MFVSMVLALLYSLPIALCLTPRQTVYPPFLNDTAYIKNTSLGTYGGTYDSPTTEADTSAAYGTYNYCQMPHPRAQEYVLPGPVKNGSVVASLVYVEYLQRHQRRTPYNILPGGEVCLFLQDSYIVRQLRFQAYSCDSVRPYLYTGTPTPITQSLESGLPMLLKNSISWLLSFASRSPKIQEPIAVYAKTYSDPTNPFLPSYVEGSCQFPQLTIGGLLDGYQHGRDIWSVYGDKLKLLPNTPDSNLVWFRSTQSPLTQQSAGGVLRGIWPFHKGSLPLHQQTNAVDTINGGFSCPAIDTILSSIKGTIQWAAHINATSSLRSDLGSLLGATASDWQTTFDHFADNFQGRLCNGYSLPCNVSDTSSCVTPDQAAEVFRAGDWEWNYYWRSNPLVKEYITLVEGLFLGEILARFEGVKTGTFTGRYSHIFVHDGDIGPVAGALGIEALRWPGMASNIVFEIWQLNSGEFFSRVLYSGQPMETIYGTLDWLPLDDLIAILTPYVPDNIVALCNM